MCHFPFADNIMTCISAVNTGVQKVNTQSRIRFLSF